MERTRGAGVPRHPLERTRGAGVPRHPLEWVRAGGKSSAFSLNGGVAWFWSKGAHPGAVEKRR